ncbi:histidinol-phosphate transaminase [Numidum massiliense]|uniref:histidinol-phosphate transaminase n=1 Tax=Numidum massiliense TaxID=1522315 RepID=UPI0006D5503A|nr:histidinol-phosphate transaminase [Numidum massiliense]
MQPKRSVRGLPVYRPGKSIDEVKREYGLRHVIKMASNENPAGCSPYVVENLLPSSNSGQQLALYPDGEMRELRQTAARHLRVEPEQLIFGNGSDEIIQIIARCFLEPGMNTVMAQTTFPRYKTNVQIENVDVVEIPLTGGTHDLEAMAAAVNERTKIVWVCNPNNPTGTIVTHDALVQFIDRIPSSTLVVLDEAYAEYVADEHYPRTAELLANYPNVIALRTFSKIYGLAALRVGYGIAQPEIVSELNRVREPFNVNALAQRAAHLALRDQSFVQACHRANLAGLEQLTTAFTRLGLSFYPPHGNFVFVDTGHPASDVYTSLLQQGIIVRADDSWGCPTAIRVTVGNEAENAAFLNAFEQFLQERGQEKSR